MCNSQLFLRQFSTLKMDQCNFAGSIGFKWIEMVPFLCSTAGTFPIFFPCRIIGRMLVVACCGRVGWRVSATFGTCFLASSPPVRNDVTQHILQSNMCSMTEHVKRKHRQNRPNPDFSLPNSGKFGRGLASSVFQTGQD